MKAANLQIGSQFLYGYELQTVISIGETIKFENEAGRKNTLRDFQFDANYYNFISEVK